MSGSRCLLIALSALACRAPLTITTQIQSGQQVIGCAAEDCGNADSLIDVTYLGVSGFLIEHRNHVLLTAPFFSNPSFGQVRPRVRKVLRSTPRITPDTNTIERLLPRGADRATTILVGHGHYDHLMDVPYIATHRATSATIYGGPSVRHMLMGDSVLRMNGGRRVVAISEVVAGRPRRRGAWFYASDSAYRFMALISGHAPTYRAWKQVYTFTSGTVDSDRDSLPHTAAEWKLGEPYSYLIDVLDDQTRLPVFRIYFQDAPSEPPLGFPPAEVLAERPIDLAVLCAATSSNVAKTPDSLLVILKPAHVMLGHWEDFFRARRLPLQLGPGTDLDALRKSLGKSLPASADWVMPLPQTTFRFRETRLLPRR
ncbi:MAG: MBL fold metallo-hydrolase [Gemmatimonadaceae bacterium]